ncbi:MAG: transglutaminase family protein, partial [Pseudomonadota bacterium]
QKIAAVRKVIYEPGPWNRNRPFSYDRADPLGRDSRNKLISTYLQTRKGNCVSMPALFLILADRLGADVTLSSAPLHIFVKWTDEAGRVTNLETTSGAHPARDVWIRQQEPFTDEAVANGVYLQKMSRLEAVAHLATVAVDREIDDGDYESAVSTAEAILEINPRDVYAMVKAGDAYGHLLRTRFYEVYPTPADIPADEVAAYRYSAKMNAEMFERAEALGWRPVQ